MHLENTFAVPVAIDVAWAVFNDPISFAPCVPGATVESYAGDSCRGTMRVTLGTFTLNYEGTGTYLRRDEADHSVLIDATGREARGNGSARAKVVGSLVADGPDNTLVTMVTELTLTGRPAQFGRATVAAVGDEMVGRFAACLARRLAPGDGIGGLAGGSASPAGAAAGSVAPRGVPSSAGSAAAAAGAGSPTGPIRTVAPASALSSNGSGARSAGVLEPASDKADAIDLVTRTGAPVLRRAAPAFLTLVLLFVVIRRIKNR